MKLGTLFRNKVSRFGSLISLIAITSMLIVFSLVLPEFLVSTSGRVFSGVWAVMAITAFIGHVTRTDGRQARQGLMQPAGKKDVRLNPRLNRTQRMMRAR